MIETMEPNGVECLECGTITDEETRRLHLYQQALGAAGRAVHRVVSPCLGGVTCRSEDHHYGRGDHVRFLIR